MQFEPEKIKREHVLKAIEDISNNIVGVRPSTKFDLYYQGEIYPPKDVMRLAHEYAAGSYQWNPPGGEPTNKYPKPLGFIVLPKEQIPYIDGGKLSPIIGKYNHAVSETDWLKAREIYKFNFIQWFETNVSL